MEKQSSNFSVHDMTGFQDFEICRNILESLQIGLCVVDLERKVVFWSDGAERITGYSRHEMVGRSCIESLMPHCNPAKNLSGAEVCSLDTAIRNAKPAESDAFLHHKAGQKIPVRIRSVPVRNAHGSIIGVAESFEEQHQAASTDHHEDGLKAPGCVDEVTGIANRAIMQSHLRETLGTFTELNVPFGILCVRVEGLTQFRANFSQEAASSLLRAVAQTLEGALWRTDFVGRWSDDQFLVILNGCSEESLRSVRERIRRMVADDEIEWWGEKRSLPVSIGNTCARTGDTAEALVERALRSLNNDASPRLRLAAAAAGKGPSQG
jgi:diguanylate cyclase (GGDEF)-like protein/PAS domain S-box-containing protein